MTFIDVNKSPSERQSNNLFFVSELGQFGHLDKNSGVIYIRESLAQGERIIQSSEDKLVILTKQGQVIHFNKNTMQRFAYPSKAVEEGGKNVHYVQYNKFFLIAPNGNVKFQHPDTK